MVSPCQGCTLPSAGTMDLRVRVQVHPACVQAGLGGVVPGCRSPSDWHRVCFHAPRVAEQWSADSLGGQTVGELLGCFAPRAVYGAVSSFPPGQHSVAVYAVDGGDVVASEVTVVDFVTAASHVQSVPSSTSNPAIQQPASSPGSVELPAHGEVAVGAHAEVAGFGGLMDKVQADAVQHVEHKVLARAVEWPPLACPMKFTVLLAGLPSPENRNLVVFEHIARTVLVGLQQLGLDAELVVCPDLRTCGGFTLAQRRSQVIVVGANVVHRYFFMDDPMPAALRGELLPPSTGTPMPNKCALVRVEYQAPLTLPCTVLFNFEYLVPRADMGKHKLAWIDDNFVEVHKHFTLWEYSAYVTHLRRTATCHSASLTCTPR